MYVVRAEYKTARELGEQCFTLAQRVQDPALLVEGHRALGQCLYLLGELVPAREHLEQGIALYGPQPHHSYTLLYWNDPGVVCRAWGAFALWLLGYPDQALKRTHEALTLARELSHAYDLAVALGRAAMLHHFRQERRVTQERAEETITLATEQGFPFFAVQGSILRGWALAEQGQMEAGIAQIRQGLTTLRVMGIESSRPHNLALLAEAYGKAGQIEEGLAALTEALATIHRGERYFEAELYRLKGELTLAQSSVQSLGSSVQKEAEECFLKGIEVARRQQAKSLELRAVMSLARL